MSDGAFLLGIGFLCVLAALIAGGGITSSHITTPPWRPWQRLAILVLGLVALAVGLALVLGLLGHPTGAPTVTPSPAVTTSPSPTPAVSEGPTRPPEPPPVTLPPTSPPPSAVQGADCAFQIQLLAFADVIERLYVPEGSLNLSGYQVTALQAIVVPAGWMVQKDTVTHDSPFTLATGDTASVYAPESCRPLPETDGSGSSPSPAPTSTPAQIFPSLVKTVITGPAVEKTYVETLGATDVIVGSGSQFNHRGTNCQVFIVSGPASNFRFVLFDGEYFVYANVLNSGERERLLNDVGIGRADEFGGCAGHETIHRIDGKP